MYARNDAVVPFSLDVAAKSRSVSTMARMGDDLLSVCADAIGATANNNTRM
jgi:hypothetical protein